MLTIIGLSLFLVVVSTFYSWRYSKIGIDPDWSMFNLYAFTGSIYGRDFLDCKTPAIHLWYWMIAKVVGANIEKVKFTHHMLIGLAAVPIYLISGSFWVAFAYLVLVQSGWLYAFHGNVGAQPAAFICLALVVDNPTVAVVLWWFALAFEPKLLLSFAAWLVVGRFVDQALLSVVVVLIGLLVAFPFRKSDWMKWLVEINLTIPKRMHKARRGLWKYYLSIPNYMNSTNLFIIPWFLFGMATVPMWEFWLPPALYVALLWYGLAVRPNHYLPIVAWVAVSLGYAPLIVILLVLADWFSSGLYLTDIWKRFYPGLDRLNNTSKQVGLYLRNRPGTIFVNDIHTGIYIYAKKPIQYGFAAQIEIREVANERREKMLQLFKEKPADWVVNGDQPLFDFNGKGYSMRSRAGDYTVWSKR